MSVQLAPAPVFQGIGFGGLPVPGGKLFTYVAGTSTPQATYVDSTQTTPNANPVILNSNAQANVWLVVGQTYKLVLQDALGNQVWAVDQIPGGLLLTTAIITPLVNPVTPAEQNAGITPTNFLYPAIYAQRYGYAADNNPLTASANVTALNTAITVASTTVAGATGATVILPTGIAYINQTINLPNRVRIVGQNLSGTIIKAASPFTTTNVPYMFYASNGTTSMFDSILQDLFIDCSDVTSIGAAAGPLGGVRSDAWQENSGMRSVAVLNCRGWCLDLEQGWGGAGTLEIQQVQFFPSTTAVPLGGVKVNCVNSTNILVHIRDSVIAGTPAFSTPRGIEMDLGNLLLENVHLEGCTDGVWSNSTSAIQMINVNGGGGSSQVGNLVHLTSAFTGSLVMASCRRNGSTVLIQNDVTGETIGAPDPATYTYPEAYGVTTSKAVARYNGSTSTLSANSYNITSVVKNSTGNYTFNLIRPCATVNLAPQVSTNLAAAQITASVSSVSAIVVTISVAGTPTDATQIFFTLFGV